MLSAVIAILALGVTPPRLEAIQNLEWRHLPSNFANKQSSSQSLVRQPAAPSGIIRRQTALESNYTHEYAPNSAKKFIFSSVRSKTIKNKGVFMGNVSHKRKSQHKPWKNTFSGNTYTVYSNNDKSAMHRNAYELWSNTNYNEDKQREKFQRSPSFEELIDDGKHYTFDDDYSLLNYMDSWKELGENTKDRGLSIRARPRIRSKVKKRHLKRFAEDKEFTVAFHSKKEKEQEKLSNNHAKRKSIFHRERKLNKNKFSPKYGKGSNFKDTQNNVKGSFFSSAKSSAYTKSSKRKYPFWSGRKEKVAAKLDKMNPELSKPIINYQIMASLSPLREGQHWATTRSYVADISNKYKKTLHPAVTATGNVHAWFPSQNLTDSLMAAKKLGIAHILETTDPVSDAPVFNSQRPHNILVGDRNFNKQNLNAKMSFPVPLNIPAAKHTAAVYGPTTEVPPPFYNHNVIIDRINPHESHLDKFGNNTTWNSKQGPPGHPIPSIINFSNFSNDDPAVNERKNNLSSQDSLGIPDHLEVFRKSVGNYYLPASTSEQSPFFRSFKIDSLMQDNNEHVEATPSPLDAADLVNLLQSAFMPKNGVFREPSINESTRMVAKSSAELNNVQDLIMDNNLVTMTVPTRSFQTGAFSLLPTAKSLLPTEPLMDRFSDIISRNADRKIPIVYDIDDAPQLVSKSLQNVTDVKQFATDKMPISRLETHDLDRRAIMKKNKTSLKQSPTENIKNKTHQTISWIILETTENMLYSEMIEQRQVLTTTVKPSRIHQLFKGKAKQNVTTVKTKRKHATANVKNKNTTAATQKAKRDCCSEPPCAIDCEDCNGCKSCREPCNRPLWPPDCACPGRRQCEYPCGCGHRINPCLCTPCPGPLELITPVCCQPQNLSVGAISCPNCHNEFTYKLNLKDLND